MDLPRIEGEQNQKDFIALFGAILRMRNLLSSFDQFTEDLQLISEIDLQNYLGRYQDLKDEWKERLEKGELVDVTNDIVFETELIKQVDINIDYILLLVKQYHDSHMEDAELRIKIQRAVESSPELRSKKALIENFILNVNDVEDVLEAWAQFIAEEKERELSKIILEENLKDSETRAFVVNAFKEGEISNIGTDIEKILPPMSRFGGGNRTEKKKTVFDRLFSFFTRFYGIASEED